MKKIAIFTYIILIIVFVFLFLSTASAYYGYYYDEAGILSKNEAYSLENRLEEIENTYGAKIFITVVNNTGNQSAYNYAADYLYSALNHGESGAILLLSMDERDWAVYATGGARSVLTDSRIDSIMNVLISDYFSENDYYNGFCGFANQCMAYFLKTEADGIDPSARYTDNDNGDFSLFTSVLISFCIGLVAAIVTVIILRGQLKSIKSAKNAANYVNVNSFSLVESRDIYLYSTVTKTQKSQSSSGSRPRSGGGRSGKF